MSGDPDQGTTFAETDISLIVENPDTISGAVGTYVTLSARLRNSTNRTVNFDRVQTSCNVDSVLPGSGVIEPFGEYPIEVVAIPSREGWNGFSLHIPTVESDLDEQWTAEYDCSFSIIGVGRLTVTPSCLRLSGNGGFGLSTEVYVRSGGTPIPGRKQVETVLGLEGWTLTQEPGGQTCTLELAQAAPLDEIAGQVPSVLDLSSQGYEESARVLALVSAEGPHGCCRPEDYLVGLSESVQSTYSLEFTCEGVARGGRALLLPTRSGADSKASTTQSDPPFKWTLVEDDGVQAVEFRLESGASGQDMQWWQLILDVEGSVDHSVVVMVQ